MIFEKFHDPGPAKKFKNFKFLKKIVFLETNKIVQINIPNNILGSFGEF